MSEGLIQRIDALDGLASEEIWNVLRDCRAELAKQAERVKALEALKTKWKCRVDDLYGQYGWTESEAFEVEHIERCADELAAVLREGKE